ncbi:hypothetical protein TSUD_337850 [Trifolium subterraneum]|uniref:Uncharacterized protein n=1 Tax=Trifolium subterraneum TaxID=3900 RepID=A0A2Z6LUC6_TRISU|nr:hypothetical protein TSUD_337850 [Trifolium subterraneum]
MDRSSTCVIRNTSCNNLYLWKPLSSLSHKFNVDATQSKILRGFGCVVRDENGDRLCGKNTMVDEKIGCKIRVTICRNVASRRNSDRVGGFKYGSRVKGLNIEGYVGSLIIVGPWGPVLALKVDPIIAHNQCLSII